MLAISSSNRLSNSPSDASTMTSPGATCVFTTQGCDQLKESARTRSAQCRWSCSRRGRRLDSALLGVEISTMFAPM